MRAIWPWVVLLWFVVWCCWPLLTGGERIFIGRISTDAVVTLWFYDLVARSGELPHTLVDFDWPDPWLREQEFPSAVDAALVAPIGRLVDLPGRWGIIQTVVVGVNAIGAAILARSVGCRGAAIVVAGGIAVLNRQLWFDLVAARMNAVWPGLAAGAMGLWLMSLNRRIPTPTRVLVVAAAAWVGALAGGVYPPYLAMMAPAGLILGLSILVRGRRWSSLLWGMAPVVLALLWIGSDLSRMTAIRGDRILTALECPDSVHALDVTWVALRDGSSGLSQPGLSVATWLLVPLALLHPMRKVAVLVAAVAAFLVALSVGPCPTWTGLPWPELTTLDQEALWRPLEQLTDYGRLASGAVLLVALLSALGVEALRRRWWPLSVLAAIGCLAFGAALLLEEIREADKWHTFSVPLTAEYLMDTPPGPAVELPFDRSQQFLSVMAHPGRARVNPLKAGPRRQTNPFVFWLLQVGRGELVEPTFDRDDMHNSGIRWVLLEPARCDQASVPNSACSPAVIDALEAALGEAEKEKGERLLVWELEALQSPEPPALE